MDYHKYLIGLQHYYNKVYYKERCLLQYNKHLSFVTKTKLSITIRLQTKQLKNHFLTILFLRF